MPFGLQQAPGVFQDLMVRLLHLLKQRPIVKEMAKRSCVVAEAFFDDIGLGTETVEDHQLLLRELFVVMHENNMRVNLKKCQFCVEELE